jgi:hypothetical protein
MDIDNLDIGRFIYCHNKLVILVFSPGLFQSDSNYLGDRFILFHCADQGENHFIDLGEMIIEVVEYSYIYTAAILISNCRQGR